MPGMDEYSSSSKCTNNGTNNHSSSGGTTNNTSSSFTFPMNPYASHKMAVLVCVVVAVVL